MSVIQTILTVKGDETLERAIARDFSIMDDKDLTESFLNQMSVQYRPAHVKKTDTVVENWDEQGGQDFNASDSEKDAKLPQNS